MAEEAIQRRARRSFDDDELYPPTSKFERIAGRFGVPVAIMIFFGAAGWAGSSWFANHVAMPLVDRHMKFIDASEASLKTNTEVISRQVEATSKVAEGLRGIETKQDETHKILTRMVEAQTQTNEIIRSEFEADAKKKTPGGG